MAREGDHLQLIRDIRALARSGASGSRIAGELLVERRLGSIPTFRVLIAAFGMELREAREAEWLDVNGATENDVIIDEAWRARLTSPSTWPKRRLELDVEEHEELRVTVRLDELDEQAAEERLMVDWGDGTCTETRTSSLPVTHEYAAPGEYAFRCRAVAASGFDVVHGLRLERHREPSRYTLGFRL